MSKTKQSGGAENTHFIVPGQVGQYVTLTDTQCKHFQTLLNGDVISESQINGIKKMLNAYGSDLPSKMFPVDAETHRARKLVMLNALANREVGPRVDDALADKGIKWLRNLAYGKRGLKRSTCPFSTQELHVIDNFSHFTLQQFFNKETDRPDFRPVYRVWSTDGESFTYYAYPWQSVAFSRRNDRRPSIKIVG